MHSNNSSGHFFIGVGVGDFDDASLHLPAAIPDVEKVARWFENHPVLAHQRALPELSNSPTSHQILDSLGQWLEKRSADDVVIIFFASHGEQEGGKSYLLGRNSPRSKLGGRAVDAETLGSLLGQFSPHNVLLIVDACVAGRLGTQIQRGAEDASDTHNTRDRHKAWAQVVLCSTFGRDPAIDGVFVESLLNVISDVRWTGTTQRWIEIDQVLRGLQAEMRAFGLPQIAERKIWGPSPAELIPNPNFSAYPRAAMFEHEELVAHFDPASRGVMPGQAGSYFAGRLDELRTIVRWLHEPRVALGRPGLLIITGQPGTGKSALLSRAVLLSQLGAEGNGLNRTVLPQDTVPPRGSFDRVLWCHNKTLRQLVRELGNSASLSLETPQELLAAFADMKLTVAFDALDEALHDEAPDIASMLIAPLARLPQMRVLVATRPRPVGDRGRRENLLRALDSGTATVIQLDNARARRNDLHTYVMSVLQAGDGNGAKRYRADAALATRLSERICDAADPSFLVGAISARAFAAAEKVADPDDIGLKLPREAGEAIAEYIDRLSKPDAMRDLLRPLAWAQGFGLPWGPLWPSLATALSRSGQASEKIQVAYTDADVGRLLDEAGDLVVENIEHGEPVYRLFHEALAEHLRQDRAQSAAHAAIARELMVYRQNSWIGAPPYIIGHLPRHLALADEMVDELVNLVTDPAWERVKRSQYNDPMAWAADVNLALDSLGAIGHSDPRTIFCCAVYSYMTAVVPSLVVEVFARAGQVARAEMLANNIGAASARVAAYAQLGRAYAVDNDRSASVRCLDDAHRCMAPVAASHRSMGWSRICAAAHDSRFPQVAAAAAGRALEAALSLQATLQAAGDTWDVTNSLFWAALAARRLGDRNALEQIRAALPREEIAIFRNQFLQAASVAGDTEILRLALQKLLASGIGVARNSIRAGNLALALADAGMSGEFEILRARLVNASIYDVGEPDAQKRYAWALALSGHMDEAITIADQISEPGERFKALSRITLIAKNCCDKATLGRIDELASQPQPSLSTVDELALLELLLAVEHLDQALVLATDVVRSDAQSLQEMSERAEPRHRKKAGRRPLAADASTTQDAEVVVATVNLLARADIEGAFCIADGIAMPAFRADALLKVALAHRDEKEALRVWLRSILAARFAGRRVIKQVLERGKEILSKALGNDAWAAIVTGLDSIESSWDIDGFAEHYQALRTSIAPSDQRTRHMSTLMSVPRKLATTSLWSREKVSELWATGQEGKRLFALGLMQGDSNLIEVTLVADAIEHSRTAFEQFNALKLVWDDIEWFDEKGRDILWRAIHLVSVRSAVAQETDAEHLGPRRLGLTELIRVSFGKW